jgi:hypothetical protein
MKNTQAYQQHNNGPLKPEVVAFLQDLRVKNHWSYKTLGEHLGISGAFAHNILNKGGNITTSTAMQWVAAGIDRLKSGDMAGADAPASTADSSPMLSHSYNLRNNLLVRFQLPADLSEREAERLALFIRSLAQ